MDVVRCSGCRRCEAACAKANGLPEIDPEELEDQSLFEQARRPGPDSFTVVNRRTFNHDDGTSAVYVKQNCMHCVDPACVSACLVGALRKLPDGPVTYDAQKCMGCRYCMVACPFEMPAYEYARPLTPRVRRCTFCFDEDHANGGTIPACVQACPKECLIYGRREELIAKAHERVARQPDVYVDHVYGEFEAGGTSWLYLSPVPFEQLGFPPVAASSWPRLTESIQHGVFKHFMPPVAWCAILGLTAWLTRRREIPFGVDSASSDNGQVGRDRIAVVHGDVSRLEESHDEPQCAADILAR